MARPRGRKSVRYLFLCHGAPHVTIFRRPGVSGISLSCKSKAYPLVLFIMVVAAGVENVHALKGPANPDQLVDWPTEVTFNVREVGLELTTVPSI